MIRMLIYFKRVYFDRLEYFNFLSYWIRSFLLGGSRLNFKAEIMDKQAMNRAITRMAHEIIEKKVSFSREIGE